MRMTKAVLEVLAHIATIVGAVLAIWLAYKKGELPLPAYGLTPPQVVVDIASKPLIAFAGLFLVGAVATLTVQLHAIVAISLGTQRGEPFDWLFVALKTRFLRSTRGLFYWTLLSALAAILAWAVF